LIAVSLSLRYAQTRYRREAIESMAAPMSSAMAAAPVSSAVTTVNWCVLVATVNAVTPDEPTREQMHLPTGRKRVALGLREGRQEPMPAKALGDDLDNPPCSRDFFSPPNGFLAIRESLLPFTVKADNVLGQGQESRRWI
jgi:hypothetical protein